MSLSKKIIPILCFLTLLGTASPLKTFFMSLDNTKNLKESINHH